MAAVLLVAEGVSATDPSSFFGQAIDGMLNLDAYILCPSFHAVDDYIHCRSLHVSGPFSLDNLIRVTPDSSVFDKFRSFFSPGPLVALYTVALRLVFLPFLCVSALGA